MGRAILLAVVFGASVANGGPPPMLDLTPPTSESGFGGSLALAGDTLVVGGTIRYDVGTGRAFLFDLETGRLRVLLPGVTGDDRFAQRVAAADDTIAVSAPGSHTVYLFDRSGRSTVSLPSDLREPDEDFFGTELAVGGGRVAVGGSTSGILVFDAASGALLRTLAIPESWIDSGFALALSEELLFVGVFDLISPRGHDVGVVHAFEVTTGAQRWMRRGRIGLGSSLAVDGPHLVVGAWRDRLGRESVGLLDAASGTLRRVYRSPRRRSGFGTAVAIRGDRVLIGAPDVGDERGRVYLFARDSGVRLGTYAITAADGRAGGEIGLGPGVVVVGAPLVEHVAVFRAPVP